MYNNNENTQSNIDISPLSEDNQAHYYQELLQFNGRTNYYKS